MPHRKAQTRWWIQIQDLLNVRWQRWPLCPLLYIYIFWQNHGFNWTSYLHPTFSNLFKHSFKPFNLFCELLFISAYYFRRLSISFYNVVPFRWTVVHWLQTAACIKESFIHFSKLFIPFICYFKLFHLFLTHHQSVFLTSYLTRCHRSMESIQVDTEWKSDYTSERSVLTYCFV